MGTTVNLSNSILVDNKKRQYAEGANATGRNQAYGVDFKNDTLLVNAKNDVTTAQTIEYLATQDATATRMDSAHAAFDYTTALGTYQRLLVEEQNAKAASESLEVAKTNILTQLTQTNQQVASLE